MCCVSSKQLVYISRRRFVVVVDKVVDAVDVRRHCVELMS